jgi:hypothetical protein
MHDVPPHMMVSIVHLSMIGLALGLVPLLFRLVIYTERVLTILQAECWVDGCKRIEVLFFTFLFVSHGYPADFVDLSQLI